MIKQHNKKQTAQTTTNNNKNIHVFCFGVLLRLLCSLLTYQGACGIVGNKNEQHVTNTETMNKQHKTNSTHNNKQQQPHTFFFVLCFVMIVMFVINL